MNLKRITKLVDILDMKIRSQFRESDYLLNTNNEQQQFYSNKPTHKRNWITHLSNCVHKLIKSLFLCKFNIIILFLLTFVILIGFYVLKNASTKKSDWCQSNFYSSFCSVKIKIEVINIYLYWSISKCQATDAIKFWDLLCHIKMREFYAHPIVYLVHLHCYGLDLSENMTLCIVHLALSHLKIWSWLL